MLDTVPDDLPPAPDHITVNQQQAATALLAAFSACTLSLGLIRELGSVVISFDLDATVWRLKGWDKPRRVPPMTGKLAMHRALAAATEPQRVRLGSDWVKRHEGVVDATCVPAHLPPAQFAWWLRRRCFAEVEAEAMLNVRPRWQPDAEVLYGARALSEYSQRTTVHPHAPAHLGGDLEAADELTAREFFAGLAASALDTRERHVLELHFDERTQPEIAAEVGCADRTVRRKLDNIKEKAMTFDVKFTRNAADDELRKLVRPMTPDEWADRCAGYAASRYQRRAGAGLAPVIPLVTRTLAARETDAAEKVAA
jgi:hypothetical protein